MLQRSPGLACQVGARIGATPFVSWAVGSFGADAGPTWGRAWEGGSALAGAFDPKVAPGGSWGPQAKICAKSGTMAQTKAWQRGRRLGDRKSLELQAKAIEHFDANVKANGGLQPDF